MYSDVEEFEGWKYRYNYNKNALKELPKSQTIGIMMMFVGAGQKMKLTKTDIW